MKDLDIGSLVLIKNKDKNGISYYPSIITEKSGNDRKRYKVLGFNFLNMPLWDIKAPGMKNSVKYVFNSLNEIFDFSKDKELKILATMMIRLEKMKNDDNEKDNISFNSYLEKFGIKNKSLFQVYEELNINNTKEKRLKDIFNESGIGILLNKEDQIKFFEKTFKEKREFSKTLYFNLTDVNYIKSSFNYILSELIKDKDIDYVLSMLRKYGFLDKDAKGFKFISNHKDELNFSQYKTFFEALYISKDKIGGFRTSIPKNIIKKILNDYISNKKEYEIGMMFDEKMSNYYQIFDLLSDDELYNIGTKNASYLLILLKNKNLSSNFITKIDNENKYNIKYEDGSSDSNFFKEKIAGHINTPLHLIEKFIEDTTQTYSSDSFGYDIMSAALSNSSLNNEVLTKIYLKNKLGQKNIKDFTIFDQVRLEGIISNKSTNINLLKSIKQKHGNEITIDYRSGMILKYNIDEEIKERKIIHYENELQI